MRGRCNGSTPGLLRYAKPPYLHCLHALNGIPIGLLRYAKPPYLHCLRCRGRAELFGGFLTQLFLKYSPRFLVEQHETHEQFFIRRFADRTHGDLCCLGERITERACGNGGKSHRSQ